MDADLFPEQARAFALIKSTLDHSPTVSGMSDYGRTALAEALVTAIAAAGMEVRTVPRATHIDSQFVPK